MIILFCQLLSGICVIFLRSCHLSYCWRWSCCFGACDVLVYFAVVTIALPCLAFQPCPDLSFYCPTLQPFLSINSVACMPHSYTISVIRISYRASNDPRGLTEQSWTRLLYAFDVWELNCMFNSLYINIQTPCKETFYLFILSSIRMTSWSDLYPQISQLVDSF